MKRSVLCLLAAFGLASAAALTAQEPPESQTPSVSQTSVTTTQDKMVIGCLVQGSSPTVFVLENAKLSTAARTDKGTSLILMPSGTNVDLKSHLNHQISVTIPADTKLTVAVATPAPGQTTPPAAAVVKLDEKDMAKITARSVTMIADTCTTVS